ncbi:hypothetical protein [Actinopolymorpha alba]|uniref:hypothetical protein n=1 Tax=Actinopolymorpha alba TaxID=533267 RepID=UPI0012F6498E|nr:hypothetical protein [Actinopolymorpha alba]
MRFLDTNTGWAAQHHPGFPDYAETLGKLRARLENQLRADSQPERSGVGCFDCGGQLVRHWTPLGREDLRECRHCKRTYSDPEYWLALRAQLQEASHHDRRE